jgi:hypothetical protein
MRKKGKSLPEIPTCTIDMLNRILYDKTQDVGKKS